MQLAEGDKRAKAFGQQIDGCRREAASLRPSLQQLSSWVEMARMGGGNVRP